MNGESAPSFEQDASNVAAAQGHSADARDPAALRRAIDLAFDYRGDVTITLASTGQTIEGYVFDRRVDPPTGAVLVRIIASSDGARHAIALRDIGRIDFTGRDTASGRSFETWVKKYLQKKIAGESASIDSESLDP